MKGVMLRWHSLETDTMFHHKMDAQAVICMQGFEAALAGPGMCVGH